ncbi:MAG: hypothetical protein ACQEP8_06625 [Chlamydiota bacterium]
MVAIVPVAQNSFLESPVIDNKAPEIEEFLAPFWEKTQEVAESSLALLAAFFFKGNAGDVNHVFKPVPMRWLPVTVLESIFDLYQQNISLEMLREFNRVGQDIRDRINSEEKRTRPKKRWIDEKILEGNISQACCQEKHKLVNFSNQQGVARYSSVFQKSVSAA